MVPRPMRPIISHSINSPNGVSNLTFDIRNEDRANSPSPIMIGRKGCRRSARRPEIGKTIASIRPAGISSNPDCVGEYPWRGCTNRATRYIVPKLAAPKMVTTRQTPLNPSFEKSFIFRRGASCFSSQAMKMVQNTRARIREMRIFSVPQPSY